MNENDFKKRFGSNSPLPPYNWSDDDYASGWNITGDMPPTRQQFDALQRTNDDKAAYLLDKVYSSARLLRRSTHYNKGDRVYAEGLKAGLYLECATAGMSGTDAIDFSSSKVGDTITDGGVTWTVVKYALTTDGRQAATSYTAGAMVTVDGLPNGWLLQCIVPGISGTDAITLPDTLIDGLTIIDGDVTWALRKVATNGGLGYRQPNTAYTAGQIAYHSALPTGYYLECTTAGITSAGEITPSSTIGDTVSDGTVVWKVSQSLSVLGGTIFNRIMAKRDVTNSGLTLIGADDYVNGAYINLYGKDSSTPSNFQITARNGSTQTDMIGKPTGQLTWGANDLAGSAIVAKSLSKIGYIKYASGLIMQWGILDVRNIAAGSKFTITFPITFSAEPGVLIVPDGGYNSFPQITYEGITTSGMTGFIKSGTSINLVHWFAIGR